MRSDADRLGVTERIGRIAHRFQLTDLRPALPGAAAYRDDPFFKQMKDPLSRGMNLGNALEELGDIVEAVDCYRRGVQLNPNHADAHHNLSMALSRLGQIDEMRTHGMLPA